MKKITYINQHLVKMINIDNFSSDQLNYIINSEYWETIDNILRVSIVFHNF